ncbi:hypothetical protein IAT40_000601 [Kwoniella sp. CBS 6097]
MSRHNKRPRSPTPTPSSSSFSSTSSASASDAQSIPPPKNKKARNTKRKSITPKHKATAPSSELTSDHPDDVGDDDDDDDDDDSDDIQSSSSSFSEIATPPPPSQAANKGTVPKSTSTSKADGGRGMVGEADEKSEKRRQSMIAQLEDMDEDLLENLLSARSGSRPANQRFDRRTDNSEAAVEGQHQQQQQRDGTTTDDVLRGLFARLEQKEVEDDPEDKKALQEQAEDLANALSGPFEQLHVSTVKTLNSRLQTLAQSVYTALQPFEGGEILPRRHLVTSLTVGSAIAARDLLNVWKDSQTAFARDACRKWDEAEKRICERKSKIDELHNKIRDAQNVRTALIGGAQKEFEKAQIRQKAEIAKLREEATKIQEKYRAKIVKATDKERIKKEINMVITQLLAQQMAS